MPYIAVLTSGGDSPGMNAAVTAIARSAALLNMPLLGVDRGFNGLLGKSPKTDFMELNLEKALDIADLPGTQLRTARCVEFKDKAVQARAAKLLRDMDVAGLIVIGGGITAARKWIMPSLLNELRSKMHQLNGNELNRVQMKVYDLDDETEFREFAKGAQRPLKVYGTDRYVAYDPQKRIGVTISKLGASQAISVGAYAFALSQLDTENA